jgi:hypothetical protein|tara:strand:- start:122 stop:691 length:570 start_codon:yes stop_codon:yes gene_type:complete
VVAIILGNGESRSGRNYRAEFPDAFVYGCNGAYKESPDALVCVDTYMQHLIYKSGYCKDNLCYFSEWDSMPSQVLDMMSGYFIYMNKQGDSDECVISGNEDNTYITWVDLPDRVVKIPEVEISSGGRALLVACESNKHTDIYLLGFDGMGAANLYQEDEGYERSTPRNEWVEERIAIMEKYSHINFKYI